MESVYQGVMRKVVEKVNMSPLFKLLFIKHVDFTSLILTEIVYHEIVFLFS